MVEEDEETHFTRLLSRPVFSPLVDGEQLAGLLCLILYLQDTGNASNRVNLWYGRCLPAPYIPNHRL